MKMFKKIPIGVEFYKEMIENNYYYLDKTFLIKDLLDKGEAPGALEKTKRSPCCRPFLRRTQM